MLPIVEGDHLVCPYCKPRQVVLIAKDLHQLIEQVKTRFKVRQAEYHLGVFSRGCGTVWLCEKVSPETNDGKPFAWDTYSPVRQG